MLYTRRISLPGTVRSIKALSASPKRFDGPVSITTIPSGTSIKATLTMLPPLSISKYSGRPNTAQVLLAISLACRSKSSNLAFSEPHIAQPQPVANHCNTCRRRCEKGAALCIGFISVTARLYQARTRETHIDCLLYRGLKPTRFWPLDPHPALTSRSGFHSRVRTIPDQLSPLRPRS